MKKLLTITLFVTLICAKIDAQKVAVGKYQVKENFEAVFTGVLSSVPGSKFTIKSTDKAQGTIMANRQSSDGLESGSLFILIKKEEEGVTSIEATFTRHPGFVGGGKVENWAKDFEIELKSHLANVLGEIWKK